MDRAERVGDKGAIRSSPGAKAAEVLAAFLPRRLIRKNYYVAKIYHELRYLQRRLDGTSPILIYQMGKVGSRTVLRSLRAAGFSQNLFHVHTLTARGRNHSQHGRGLFGSGRQYYERSKHHLEAVYLAREVARGLHDGRWKVITMIRDPLARNISSYFQVVDLIFTDFYKRYNEGNLSEDELLATFLRYYPARSVFSEWFDDELKTVFGVDVFESEFPRETGYRMYSGETADVLLLKMEMINACAERAFEEYLDIKNFRVVTDNRASEKPYYEAYKRFRRKLVLPRDYVDDIYSAKSTTHFYTAEEIAAFRKNYEFSAEQECT